VSELHQRTKANQDQAEYFKTLLLRPIKNGDPAAGKLLQALVGQILLRRTKESKDLDGKRLVDLPPIEYFEVKVALDEETKTLYDEIFRVSTEAFIAGQVGPPGTSGASVRLKCRIRQISFQC
jgi:SWI/SNF-related matrix-associated actin-dependent regulator of chromatin subfamily A3